MRVFRSRHTPGVTGSQIDIKEGEMVKNINPTHRDFGRVGTVRSGLMRHDKAPGNGLVYEVRYDGEFTIYAVLADNLLPVELA